MFCANHAENNEVEEGLLKKDENYMVTGLPVSQKAETDVIIPDLNARHSLNDTKRSYEEERKTFNLDCHFYKKDLFDITVPFKKVLTAGYTYFDTTTNKTETIKIYDYYNHIKDFGFKWENDLVKYEIILSADQKQIEKKNWCVWDKGIYSTNEITMIHVYNGTSHA